MRHENSRKLFQYWNLLRNGRKAPDRSEIEPSDIREILGDTFILEVSTQLRTISFRLAGTRLCAAYGRELKGLGYLALWSEEDNYDVAKAVSRVYSEFAPILLSYSARTESGKFAEFEAVLLPLMPAADGDFRILGIASPREAYYWLGADAVTTNHLRMARLIETDEEAPALAPGMEDLAGGNETRKWRRFGHLTVLDGGRN